MLRNAALPPLSRASPQAFSAALQQRPAFKRQTNTEQKIRHRTVWWLRWRWQWPWRCGDDDDDDDGDDDDDNYDNDNDDDDDDDDDDDEKEEEDKGDGGVCCKYAAII